MKTTLLTSIAIVGIAGIVFGSAETELKAIEQQWADAYVKGDVAALKSIEGDDWTLVDSNGTTSTRAQDVKDLEDKIFVCKSMVFSDIKVYSMGENFAYVTGLLKMTATYKGKDISGDYRGVDVFERKDNKWQARYSQLTKVEKAKE